MIYQLQGLRALAMLGIFLFHSWLFPGGSLAVIFFFMLSGFVTYYSQYKKIDNMNLRDSGKWILNKVKKMYPVYFITMIFSIFIKWEWVSSLTLKQFIEKFSLNLIMIQSCFRNEALNFNSLSWFLSVLFIICIFTIPIIKFMKKLNLRQTIICIVAVLIIQYIINILNVNLFENMYLYSNPAYRIFEFILGMLVAQVFILKKLEIKYSTALEVVIGVIFILKYILAYNGLNFIGLSYYNILFIIAIYIFALGKGSISELLQNRILQYLAKISFEFYMVHELILDIFRKVFKNSSLHWILNRLVISIISFGIAIIVSTLLKRYISDKSLSKRKTSNLYRLRLRGNEDDKEKLFS